MIKENEYEVYELVLRDDEDSVFALSLVSTPAIMQDFIFFNAEGKQVIKFATANEDKHLIVGPILIPDIKILRLKEDGVTPYYVTFTRETVEKIAQKYIKDNNANNITLEHMESVNNVSLVESWIVESSVYDKSKAYGLTVKPGTWMGVFSLENNKELWNDYVKTGLVKGISLEGLFTHELIKASKVKFDIFEKDIEELTEDEATIVLSKIKELLEQPSIPNSSYPGEAASGSIAPATFAVEGCPEATQNIKLNIANRQKAIDEAQYGPINPNEPNEDYWKAKADQFKGNVEEAKKALCGNCAFFYRTPQILKCIAEGLGEEVDPYEAIDAGSIGYCDAFDFKCAANRTCAAWVAGGPITE